MLMYVNDIAEQLKTSVSTLKLYLCRAEFNKNRTNKSAIYNMESEDLEHLRELIRNRNGGSNNSYGTFQDWKERTWWAWMA